MQKQEPNAREPGRPAGPGPAPDMCESLPAMACRFSADGDLLYANPAFRRFFGIGRESSAIIRFYDLFPRSLRSTLMQQYQTLSPGESSATRSLSVADTHGRVRWLWFTSRVQFNPRNLVPEYVALAVDITPLRSDLEEAEETAERYRLLAEQVADGVCLIQDGTVVFANPAFAALFGVGAAQEMEGVAADTLVATEYLDAFLDACREAVDGERPEVRIQVRCVAGTDADFWADGIFARIGWKGRPAALVTLRDITDRKMAEEAMQEEADVLRRENVTLKDSLKDRYRFGDLVGKSAAMLEVYGLLLQACESDAGVLIYGESGTGKDLISRTIHELGRRRQGGFVPVNCGAIPESLFESEFFGHKKGAFTGALMDKHGFFDLAHGGTLFLDEVSELTHGMQVKLLRAIEGGGYRAVGDSRNRRADVRIVAATNVSLVELVKKGLMREDFFYRIHVIPIHVPPLRDRRDDIPLLVEHFLEQETPSGSKTRLSPRVMEALIRYNWPGNVRELRNVIQRYITTGRLDFLEALVSEPARDLPASEKPEGVVDFKSAVRNFEKNLILKSLEKTRWHKARAAELLGIPRRSFFRKLSEYGID